MRFADSLMEKQTLCSTCGEPVRVVEGDEGTMHYESVAAQRLSDLATAVDRHTAWTIGAKVDRMTAEWDRDQALRAVLHSITED